MSRCAVHHCSSVTNRALSPEGRVTAPLEANRLKHQTTKSRNVVRISLECKRIPRDPPCMCRMGVCTPSLSVHLRLCCTLSSTDWCAWSNMCAQWMCAHTHTHARQVANLARVDSSAPGLVRRSQLAAREFVKSQTEERGLETHEALRRAALP